MSLIYTKLLFDALTVAHGIGVGTLLGYGICVVNVLDRLNEE